MRRLLIALSLVVVSAACATKKYVNTSVTDVNKKVDTLSGSVEETQARTKQNETRITEVDQKAQAAAASAAKAAGSADAKATAADAKAMAAANDAKAVGAKADELDKASRRLMYTVVLSEDQGNFKFNAVALPDQAKARIDDLVNQLKADPKGVYFEIEGHTDGTGPANLNERIGLERADTVKRYLYEAHQIPLHKINIISFGEEKPVGDNKTTDGRAKNRRVVIRVLN